MGNAENVLAGLAGLGTGALLIWLLKPTVVIPVENLVLEQVEEISTVRASADPLPLQTVEITLGPLGRFAVAYITIGGELMTTDQFSSAIVMPQYSFDGVNWSNTSSIMGGQGGQWRYNQVYDNNYYSVTEQGSSMFWRLVLYQSSADGVKTASCRNVVCTARIIPL